MATSVAVRGRWCGAVQRRRAAPYFTKGSTFPKLPPRPPSEGRSFASFTVTLRDRSGPCGLWLTGGATSGGGAGAGVWAGAWLEGYSGLNSTSRSPAASPLWWMGMRRAPVSRSAMRTLAVPMSSSLLNRSLSLMLNSISDAEVRVRSK